MAAFKALLFTEKVVDSPWAKFSHPHSPHSQVDFISLVIPRCWLVSTFLVAEFKSHMSGMVPDVDSPPHYSLSECPFSIYNFSVKIDVNLILPLSPFSHFSLIFKCICLLPCRITEETIETCELDVNNKPWVCAGSSLTSQQRKGEVCVGRQVPRRYKNQAWDLESAAKKQDLWMNGKASRIWWYRIGIINSHLTNCMELLLCAKLLQWAADDVKVSELNQKAFRLA